MNNQYFYDYKSYNEYVKQVDYDFIKILSVNTRSVSSISKFNKFKNELSKFSKLPDVVAIQESWFNERYVQLYNIPGYEAIHCCRDDGYGGASLYLSTRLKYEVLTKKSVNFIDFIIIRMPEIRFSNKPLHIVNLYRSQKCDCQSFLHSIEWILDEIGSGECIVLGDFNVDMNTKNLKAVSLTNLFSEYDMYTHHNLVTRPISGTSIDGVFGNIKSGIVVNSVENQFSDHNYLSCILRTEITLNDNIDEHFYRIDYEKFGEYIDESMKLDVNLSDPSKQCDDLVNCLKDAISLSSERIGVHKDIHHELTPWMTKKLVYLIKFKNNLLKKKRKNKHNKLLLDQIKRISNVIKYAKKSLVDSYYKNCITSCGGDPKKVWRFLNKEFGRNLSKSYQLRDDKGNQLLTDDEKAVAHNNYFYETLKKMRSNIIVNSDDNINNFRTLLSSQTRFNLRKVDMPTVELVLESMPKNKGSGHDGITTKMLLIRKSFISLILTRIFNSIVETSSYPDVLKVHKVIPIPKNHGAHNINMYRPISLLSTISKVFEKMMYNQMSDYIENNNLIFCRQYGFRKGSGTEAAVVSLVNDICDGLDKGFNGVAAVFFDLSKAFDLVDHAILTKKLEFFGFQDSTITLLKSYLNNRKQYVQIGNSKSSLKPVECGVPQGSILGPLLFKMYINDIQNISFKGKLLMFADDICILYNYKHPLVLRTEIEYDASMLFEYARLNKLSMNAEKTQFVRFRPYILKRDAEMAVYIDGKLVFETLSVKYLGVNLSYNLSWDNHIEMLKTKISRATGILRKFKSKLSVETKLQLYYALIHSYFVYVPIAYGYKNSVALKSLQSAQNKALKVVYNLPSYYPTVQLFKTYAVGVLPVKAIYKQNLLMFIFKSSKGLGNTFIQFNQHFDLSHRSTRQQRNLKSARCRLELTKQRIEYAGPHEYNALPQTLKDIATISAFKRNVKSYLLERLETFL